MIVYRCDSCGDTQEAITEPSNPEGVTLCKIPGQWVEWSSPTFGHLRHLCPRCEGPIADQVLPPEATE